MPPQVSQNPVGNTVYIYIYPSRLAVNRGSRLDFTPRPTLFFLPAGFCCLVSSIEETPSARLSKLENYGFDQLVSQRD